MISYFYHVIKLTLFFLIEKNIYLCLWQEKMSLSFSFLFLKKKIKIMII